MTSQQPQSDIVHSAYALIDRLKQFKTTFPAVVRNFSPVDTLWKPDPQSWSVLEIVGHMLDEEIEDFRTRVFMTLNDPEADWPPIDPQGWAVSKNYQSKDLQDQLTRWINERQSSLKQLTELKDPDWSSTKAHPHFGPMSAIGLLAAWCAHDALHLRQLARRLHQLAIRDANSDPAVRYAGDG